MDYSDFIVKISPAVEPHRYAVTASSATEGEARGTFDPPFDETELENFILKVGLTRRGVRRIHSPEWQAAQAFGQRLYSALFCGQVQALLLASRNTAHRSAQGLRIKIVLDAPALANYPWEYLCDPSQNRFLTLYETTPIVRYVELSAPLAPLRVAPPLRVLVAAASPVDYTPLDVEREHANLSRAVQELQSQCALELVWLEQPTVEALRDALLRSTFHIFHFIGHGGFDASENDGVLVFEDETRRGCRVSAERIAIVLGNHPTLRLAVLNACEGARTSVQDPFAGAALTLVRSAGIPAVVAMQFEITDRAGIAFSRGLYGAIAAGRPVDAAVTQARLAVFAEDNDIEWGTPVLYLRAPDGVIFAPLTAEEVARLASERAEREERRAQADRERQERERQEQARLAAEKERQTAEKERQTAERVEQEGRAHKIANLERGVRSHIERQEFGMALTDMDALLALDPTNAAALELQQQARAGLSEQERAAREQTARERSEQIDRFLEAARRYFANQQFEQTIAALDELLALEPWHALAIDLRQKAQAARWERECAGRERAARAASVQTAPETRPENPPAQPAPSGRSVSARRTAVARSAAGRTRSPVAMWLVLAGALGLCACGIAAYVLSPLLFPPARTPTLTATRTATRAPTVAPVGTVLGGGGGKIAFESTEFHFDFSSKTYWISVMNVKESWQTPLTIHKDPIDDRSPDWSPDGKRIAFQSNRTDNGEIYVMNADGSNPTRLTYNKGLEVDHHPDWSPDGRQIAFNSSRDGNGEIYVMNADGSEQRNLTNDKGFDDDPDWSPDGKRIAFSSERDGNREIYVMNADGSNPARLTNNTASDSSPAWSPDGKSIAFASDRRGNMEIYVMNADGSDPARLTNNAASDSSPAWSPDGKHIVFSSNRDGNREIYVMNADGSEQTNMTDTQSNDEDYPAWQP